MGSHVGSVRDGGIITYQGNRSGREMNAREHDELEQVRVETGKFAHLRWLVMACNKNHALRWARDDSRRGGNDGALCD